MSQMMLMNPFTLDNGGPGSGKKKGSNSWSSIVKKDVDILQKWNISIPGDVLLLPDSEQKHIRLSSLIAAKADSVSESNTITVKEIGGKKQQALIKGIVSLTPVQTEPEDINAVKLVKDNPLSNPNLPDNVIVSALGGLSNSMGIYYLSEEAQKYFLKMLTEKKVKDAELYSKGLGIAAGSAGIGVEVLAFKLFMQNSRESEKYSNLAIYSGIAGLAAPTLDLLKSLYNRFFKSSTTQNTTTQNTTTQNQNQNQVYVEWTEDGQTSLIYRIDESGNKVYLNTYDSESSLSGYPKHKQISFAGYPKHKIFELSKRQEPMKKQMSGYPSVESRKMPWWNGN